MSVTLAADGVIVLEGVCLIEDAEVLLRRLSDSPGAPVDWSGCEQAHTAVIQVLMAAAPRMVGSPTEAFLREHVAPLIGAS
jgi:hypothetical protein